MNYSSISRTAAGILLVALLSACGGGSTPETVALAPAPTTFTIAGTAATGAALDGATITIIGSDGTSYPAAGDAAIVTGTDGSYSVVLPLTAKPPFVVQAVKSDISLVSVIAEAKDTTTNITPVTNLIASRLSSSGDPAKLAAEFLADPKLLDLAKITASVAEVVALIKPVVDAVGDSTDPLNGNIQAAVAAGTGADKVLDSLAISITPSSATTVNIEISVKQKLAEGDQPAIVTFTNAATPAAPLPTIAAADLVESGTASLIADFLKRMTACYALAPADRVASGGTTAADIAATACKDLFYGNDPANFKQNGAIVGSPGAWSSLFGSSSGATFDRGSYEFTRGNGDLVIGYRATDSSGNSSNNTLVVKTDTDGKLRAIGNQYKYNGAVNAYQQVRTFINQSAADYYSTGYNLHVNNTADVAGIAKIVVTSPKGNTLVLLPSAGSAYFPLARADGTISGTNFVRLERLYSDTAKSGDPADVDTTLFFSPTRYASADIIAIPAQSAWKFDYYLKSAPTVIDATQYYKTRARAMTVAELQAQPLAALAQTDIDAVKANIATTNGFTYLPTPATGPAALNWEVPAGALAPSSIQMYGNYVSAPATRSGFNDKFAVKSTDRSGSVSCSSGGSGDTHCDSAGNYANGDRFTGVHLWAQDAAGRDFASFYAFYTVTIP